MLFVDRIGCERQAFLEGALGKVTGKADCYNEEPF